MHQYRRLRLHHRPWYKDVLDFPRLRNLLFQLVSVSNFYIGIGRLVFLRLAGQSTEETVNKRPLMVLRNMVGKKVLLKLKNDHSVYKGNLLNVDVQMNLIMGGTMEYDGEKEAVNFNLVLIRGSNILYIGRAEEI